MHRGRRWWWFTGVFKLHWSFLNNGCISCRANMPSAGRATCSMWKPTRWGCSPIPLLRVCSLLFSRATVICKSKSRNTTGRKGSQETTGTNSNSIYFEARLRGRIWGAFVGGKGFGRNCLPIWFVPWPQRQDFVYCEEEGEKRWECLLLFSLGGNTKSHNLLMMLLCRLGIKPFKKLFFMKIKLASWTYKTILHGCMEPVHLVLEVTSLGETCGTTENAVLCLRKIECWFSSASLLTFQVTLRYSHKGTGWKRSPEVIKYNLSWLKY